MIVGNQDILTPRGDSEELAERIPTAELVVISGAAHGFMVEHATTFNRVLLDFLRRAEEALAGPPGRARRRSPPRPPADRAETLIYVTGITLFGATIWASFAFDYSFALLLGIAFQFAAVRPMSRLTFGRAVGQAAKADLLSLTAFEVGLVHVDGPDVLGLLPRPAPPAEHRVRTGS